MTISEQLKTSFPPTIKTENPIFGAMVTNEKKTGAIETVLNKVAAYAKEYTSSSDIYNQSGSMLDKTAAFFSFLDKYDGESDEGYIRRLKAIFYRGGDSVWGTPYNIIHVFQLYFPSAEVFLCENTQDNSDNLLLNGDFEDETDYWTYDNAEISDEARFSKSAGAALHSDGSILQTLNLDKTDYYLHFFMKGSCKLQITNSAGKYWNNKVSWDAVNRVWENGKWQDEEYSIIYKKDDWGCCSTFIAKPESADDITIKIINTADEDTWVDYARLFEYINPSFTLICHYESSSDVDAAALADNGQTHDLDNYYYHDNAFLTGINNAGYAQDLYEDLLKYLKSVGVQTFFEIVNREE